LIVEEYASVTTTQLFMLTSADEESHLSGPSRCRQAELDGGKLLDLDRRGQRVASPNYVPRLDFVVPR
jgi:hypothetical protein